MADIDVPPRTRSSDESAHGLADGALRSGKPRQRTLRFRLACLVLACVLPVCLIGGFLVYHAYQQKRNFLEQRVLETARALSQVVDRELANMQASATALATSPSLASGDFAAFHRQAELVLRDYPGGDIILADAAGQQLVNSFVPFGKPLPKRNVPDVVSGVYATGRPVVSNLFKGAVTGRPLLSVDVPVFRDGRVVYDLALTIPAERLLAVLSQQRISPEWTNSIYDGNFVMVARNRFPERYVGLKGNPVLFKRLTETAEGSGVVTNKEGIDILAIFSRSATTGWTVVIGIPKAVFVADIWQSLKWAVCGIALLLIAGIGLALFLAQRIADSIKALVAPALALGSGEPVDIGQLDLAETSAVGQSLVKASQLLQQRTAERERAEAIQRHAEELERSNAEFQRREVDAQAHATEVSAILEELRGSEERLRLLGDNLPDSMVYQYTHELDGTPRFLYVSAGIERFNGVKAEDVLNDAGVLHRQFLPEELPGLLEAERASARDLSVFEHEMQMRLPDGQIRWMHLHSRPRRLPDGRTVWDGVQTDITERKRAEDAVRESEAKYRHLFNSIEEMVTVYQVERNDQGRIVECRLLDANPAFLRAAAVSSIDEIRGKTSSEVFGRDWSAAHIDAIQQALDTDKTLTQEVHHAELDRDYITTVVPLDANTYLGTGRDVTERKRSEQALLRSEKLASVGRMASTIAHEINNPLETIGHAVYLALTDSETSPKAKSYLELATQELDRVTHITKQTLAFNREDKTPTLIDLRTSVDSVVKLFAPRLKSRGIAVEKRYAEAECIRAGGGEIQQIISNLLSNSMDATPNHGKIMLRVSPSIGRNGSRLVRFTIADTGSGIPPERQKKIFEPFFTTKEIIGTGLGLWVTKQIVDKYGATIRVRSKPKRGTVFSIAFPAAEEIDKHAEGGSAE